MKNLWGRLKFAYICWWARRLPPCDELLPLMSRRMEVPLALRQRLILFLHNHICGWCKTYSNQLQLLRTAMQQEAKTANPTLPQDSLSQVARDRMKKALGNN